MKKPCCILLIGIFAAGLGFAQSDGEIPEVQEFLYQDGGRRDPFWPLVTDSGSIISYDDDELSASDVLLQGILTGADEKVAVINGKIVREGDMVGAFRIESVMPSYVILDNGQEKVEVHLGKED